jgi:hypothetical protein
VGLGFGALYAIMGVVFVPPLLLRVNAFAPPEKKIASGLPDSGESACGIFSHAAWLR